MILTLKELADYLRVSERTILRMNDKNIIHGEKIGGQWRFNGKEIDQAFFPSMATKGAEKKSGDKVDKDSKAGANDDADDVNNLSFTDLPCTHIGISVSRMLNENRMVMHMEAKTRDEAIAELLDPRFMNSLVLDINDLKAKCLARENVLSTAIGDGIAVPHPRDPVPTLRCAGCIIYGHSDKGIEFGAPDGKPVNDFFLICSQNIELHLHLMACLASLLRDNVFKTALPKAKTPADVIRLAMEHERREFSNPEQ
jgi:PTS system nitrogen regulatory IIA component